ncbi:uncharacterized protein LOC120504850 [Passer montanus]|uniref:uncharacterized protein LOC120504850 n=1 Tax=Passer montanus TaxID=9160 RepID=UPI00195F5421|nr:uncharacterized protein LOC120504850 [Passer montanus]
MWHMSYTPALIQNRELMGKLRPSSEHIQHGLGMGIVGKSQQEPSPTVQQFLVSLPRVPRSDQAKFIHAGLGKALIRRGVLSSLDAGYSSALEERREPQAHFDAWPREGEGAHGEAVPGGAAAAGDSEDHIKDGNLSLDLSTGKLKMMDFNSGTFFKARLHSKFTDESTCRGMLPDLGIAQPGREQKVPPWLGWMQLILQSAAQLLLAGLGAWAGVGTKWEWAPGPANSPQHPPCPGLCLGQPA